MCIVAGYFYVDVKIRTSTTLPRVLQVVVGGPLKGKISKNIVYENTNIRLQCNWLSKIFYKQTMSK
jgi:hypothetical protein